MLYLASSSVARLQLLQQVGLDPVVASYHLEEATIAGEATRDTVARLARSKLEHFLHQHPLPTHCPWIALAADTLLECEGQSLGKAEGREQAQAMLRLLAGKSHLVHTAVALQSWQGSVKILHDQVEVCLRPLSTQEIDLYLDLNHWQGAAGSYRLQQAGVSIIEALFGSPSTVVGLPLQLLVPLLEQAGCSLGGGNAKPLPIAAKPDS